MKHVFPILLILVLLLAGCDLRNRQDSENFIPTGTYRHDIPTAEPPAPGNQSSPYLKSVIKTVRSYSGEIPMTYPVRTYSYELPLIDLSGSHAAGCNQDIEAFFGVLIDQSLEAMKRYEDPILERLSYSSFTHSGILTLRVDRRDYNGAVNQAWYTVDEETGEAVSVSRLFAAAGISGDPNEILDRAVLERFTARYGPLEGSDAAHTTAWNRTVGSLSPLTANRMHLNENGSLTVVVELFAPEGGSSVVELVLP